MKKKLLGIIKLTRLNDHIGNDIIVPSIAFFFSKSNLNWTNLLAVAANILMITYAFMLNDVEDNEDDAKDPAKKIRNPVSAGLLSRKEGLIACVCVALLSAICYFFISPFVFIMGMISIVVGSLYSLRIVRFKKYPIIDVVSHGIFHGVFPFVLSFLSCNSNYSLVAIIVTVGIFFASVATDLRNEVRDVSIDRIAKLKNTVSIIGVKWARRLILFFRIFVYTIITCFILYNLNLEAFLLILFYLLVLSLIFLAFKKSRKFIIPNIKSRSEVSLLILGTGLITLIPIIHI